jgi:hypothetical protein
MSLPLATPITNDDEYYAARERIKDLSHSLKGSPEDDVLIALSVAVETWEKQHPPISGTPEQQKSGEAVRPNFPAKNFRQR